MFELLTAATLSLIVQVEPRQLTPGTPVRVTVSGAGAGVALTGTFVDQPLHFLQRPDGAGWVAFTGVDLDDEPGRHRLVVRVQGPGTEAAEKIVELTIADKEFPTERLRVERDFVEPPPEVSERIARESRMMRALWAEVTPEFLTDGVVRRPLPGVKGRNFGRRRIFNNQPRSPHSGIDLSAPTGTEVTAAASGRVVVAEELYFSGNLVVLDHGGGVYTLYAHLSEIDVGRGDRVRAGTLIGRVGATGRVTGPHLHWGARIGRARVDPSTLLKLLSDENEDGA